MTHTVIGLFPTREMADEAVDDLVSHGFSREEISIVASESSLGSASKETPNITTLPQTGGSIDTGRNAAVGGVAGFLLGMAALAIPGVGPLIAAGPLAAGLSGAAAGAATGGLIGALGKHGIPAERAHEYSDALRAGRLMLTVHTNMDRVEHAADILDRNGAVSINEPVGSVKTTRKAASKALDPAAVRFDESTGMRAKQQERERRSAVYPGVTGGGSDPTVSN